jgi:hypothetical protein
MKKILITFLLISLFKISYSQELLDGTYGFDNKTHSFVIYKTPTIVQVALISKQGSKQQNAIAEKRVAPKYSDTPGKVWYEFTTDSCSYDFDIPKNTLTLNVFDCKNESKDSKLVFVKKGFQSLSSLNQQIEKQKKANK